MSERQILKGKLRDLEDRQAQLVLAMRSGCERVGVIVNPLIKELAEMNIAEAAQLMDEIVVQQAELLSTISKIASIRAELYG
jgi:hypothetical protein